MISVTGHMVCRGDYLTANFDGVLFDLDGTLIDNNEGYMEDVLARVGEHMGRSLTVREARDLWYSRGASTRDDIIRGWGLKPDTFWEVFNQFDTPENRIENTYLHEDIDALYEIPIQKAIVTHTPTDITLRILDMFGISEVFSAVVSCDECSGWKPSPLPVIYALAELGLSPGKAIFVGDTESDVDSARDAGVTSVILDRNGWHANSKADFNIISLHELPELLGI